MAKVRINSEELFEDSITGDVYRKLLDGTYELVSIGGATRVTDGISGVARNRFISATTNTLPTLAGSGTATWTSPGVRGVVIDSIRVVSGTLSLAANADLTVRFAVDAANDAAAAILLPLTPNTSSATADVGQVGSFCLQAIMVPDYNDAGAADQRAVQLVLPAPVYIDVSDPIFRFDTVHQIGTTVVLQFGIRALEAV